MAALELDAPSLKAVARAAPRRALAALVLVCLAAFAVQSATALRLGETRAFDYYNIFFDTDASEGVAIRAHGWAQDARADVKVPNYLHPLINYMTTPAIRLAVVPVSEIAGRDAFQVREAMALLVSPLCAALAAFTLGTALLWLKLPARAAVGAAALYSVSFSTLMFGAIPDHFAMGGLSIALLFAWLAWWASEPRPVSRRGWLAWTLAAAFAAAVTVTNVAVAAIVLTLVLARRGPLVASAVRSGLAAGAVLAAVLLAAFLAAQALEFTADRWGFGPAPQARPVAATELGKMRAYTGLDPASIAAKGGAFGLHLAQGVAGLGVERTGPYSPGNPDVILPAAPAAWPPLGAALAGLVWAAVGFGAWAGLRRAAEPPVRLFTLACVLVLAMNLALHSVYGRVPFLYTQHWTLATSVLIAWAFLALSRRWRPWAASAAGAGLLVALAAANVHWTSDVAALAQASVRDYRAAMGQPPP